MTEANSEQPTAWRTYEQVTEYLLNQLCERFGLLRVEGQQKLEGRSGAYWSIEAKGVTNEEGRFVVIECRRYKSRLNQESMGGFANRINDLGAEGGILVTPVGLQKGAALVAKAHDIAVAQLNADATTTDFELKLQDQVIMGRSAAITAEGTLTAKVEVRMTQDDETEAG